MILTVTKPVEIEASTIRLELPDRYSGEDIGEDFPGRHKRDGSKHHWISLIVDIDTGVIRNWPESFAVPFDLHMKVCDEGIYTLFDEAGNELAKIEDYVPDCVPGKYGDYVEFTIEAGGVITQWKDRCDPDDVAEAFFPQDAD